MKLYIKILDKTNLKLIDYYTNYESYHNGSCISIKLMCPCEKFYNIGECRFCYDMPLGIACQPDDLTHGYYLYPCCWISDTPFRMSNSPCIIDPNYRSEIIAKVDLLRSYNVNKGNRLFQLCSYDLSPIEVEVVDEFN